MSTSREQHPSFDHYFPEYEADLPEPGPVFIGGFLGVDILLEAYSKGLFPWNSEGEAIQWWSPEPRCVFIPGHLKISRSLRNRLNRREYHVTIDRDFTDVMTACGSAPGRVGATWIYPELILTYTRLHELGYAHSFEVRDAQNELIGGLYGVSLGCVFFGESMFSLKPDASKVALAALDSFAQKHSFSMIDAQVENPFLMQMGARLMSRQGYLKELEKALNQESLIGNWSRWEDC